MVSSFKAYVVDGQVVVNWSTISEAGTAGFNVERKDPATKKWVTVNEALVPALFESPNGGTYSLVDAGAERNKNLTYRLVEVEVAGSTVIHGPYQVKARDALPKGQAFNEISGGDDMVRVSKSPGLTALSPAAAARGWIRTPSKVADRLRIEVTSDGLHKVVAADLVSGLRLTEARARELIRTNGLQLTSQGKTVAYLAAADGSALYFYGEAIDSIYTDDNVYWLKVGKGTAIALPATEAVEEEPAVTSTTGTSTTTTTAATTTTTEAPAPTPPATDTSTTTAATSTTEFDRG